MGNRYSFKCQKCNYTADVCGDSSAGMLVVLKTIHCLDCKKLYDVVVLDTRTMEEKAPRCPKSKKHRFQTWKYPDVCPQCGNEMENEGMTMLWD